MTRRTQALVWRLVLWARWAAWLDKYVKNPAKAEPANRVTTEQALVVR